MISCERYSMLRWLVALGYSADKLRHLSDRALQSIINEGTACVHCGQDDTSVSDGLCEACNRDADEWERNNKDQED